MDPETTFHSLSLEAAAPAAAAHGTPSVASTRPARPSALVPEVQDAWLLGFVQSAIALTALALLSPVMLVVAVLVRATSPGPILYRGARLGQGMRPFSIFKFRTLRVGSEGEIGARLLQPRDSFYTPIGRFLKRTKLDEIPQLWNVVRGDMNLVGPRPVRPVFLEEFLASIPGYARRFAMKPGLTGVAQLRGGYFTTPAAKLRYEMWYLRERSVSLDLAILTLTSLKLLNRWITLGGLLFALFVCVSFMPSGILDSFYLYAFGVRMSVAHLAVAAVGAWLLVRRRHADDRIVIYRTPLLVPMLVFSGFALLSAAFSSYHYQAARGALYYVVTGFLITSGIVNGTFTRSLVERAVQVVALGAVGVAVVGVIELAMKVGARGDTLLAGWLAGPGITATLGSPLVVATYLVLGVPALLYQLTVAEEGPQRDFWMAGSTIAFVGIILTKSPVGMVAISVSALLVVWRFFPRAVVPCGLVLFPFIYLSAPATFADWRDSLCGPNGTLCSMLAQGSWLQLLLGTGARTLGEHGLAAEVLDPERSSFHIRLLVETGILGWLGILWVLATALVSLYRAHRDVNDPRLQALLWAVFCSVVGFVITLQSFSAFENLTLQVFFWGVLGIGIGAAVRFGARQREYAVVVKLGH
jgi:lipopolysaccharide/colanic/teichoic acid biosynthesis glycosyltransferase